MKSELKTASLLPIPIPTSASRIAMRSFAPSPTIPTLWIRAPNVWLHLLRLLYFSAIFSFSFLIITAFVSGVALAKMVAFVLKKISYRCFMKSKSIAKYSPYRKRMANYGISISSSNILAPFLLTPMAVIPPSGLKRDP